MKKQLYDYPTWKRVKKLASLVKGEKVLDIGCSPCLLKCFLPQKMRYYGFDQKNATCYFPGIKIYRGDISKNNNLPTSLKKQSFDTVVLGETLEHLKNPTEALSNTFKLLKPGGKLVGSCPNSLAWRFFLV